LDNNIGKKTKEENKEILEIYLWSKTRPASSIQRKGNKKNKERKKEKTKERKRKVKNFLHEAL